MSLEEFKIHQEFEPIINEIFGNVSNFINKIPPGLERVVINYISNEYVNEDVKDLAQNNINKLISCAIKDEIKNLFFIDLNTIFLYCKYVPIEEVIKDKVVRKFIERCGLENLVNFNKNNGFLDSIIGKNIYSLSLLEIIASMSLEDIEKPKDLFTYIEEKIYQLRSSNNIHDREMMKEIKKQGYDIFPKQFLDYDLLEQLLEGMEKSDKDLLIFNLEQGFNGDIYLLLKLINENKKLIPVFKNKKIVIKPNTSYSTRYLKKLHEVLGDDKFIEIASLYGVSLIHLFSINDYSLLNQLVYDLNITDDYSKVIDDTLYKTIILNRKFDIRILPESFKNKHPELYLKDDAPADLVECFYGKETLNNMYLVNPKEIQNHPEWMPHLMHIDLSKCMEPIIAIIAPLKKQEVTLYEVLALKFTQEEILRLFAYYGEAVWTLDTLFIDLSLNKEQLFNFILSKISTEIRSREAVYEYQKLPKSFKKRYPELFLDEDSPKELFDLFYGRCIDPSVIQEHPEWIKYLLDKEITSICSGGIFDFVVAANKLGLNNEELFDLFKKYGMYLITCDVKINHLSREELEKNIKLQIIESITIRNTYYDESARSIIGNEYPELFLDEKAPIELKKYFYNYNGNTFLTFELLKEHKEWLPFIKEKNILLSMKKSKVGVDGIVSLFIKYGDEEAIRIGMKNPESVMKMLENDKLDLLSYWYDKLHFVPHYVVMMNFPKEQIDKFATSGKKWSQLMRIDRYNLNEESKSALLKASMCFGVFDNDDSGFNKIIDLFTGIPEMLSSEDMQKMLSCLDRYKFSYLFEFKRDYTLQEEKQLEREFMHLFDLLNEAYEKNEDGTYTLKIDLQQNENKINKLRWIMEKSQVSTILTPDKAHKLFGGFIMKYDPDFRDFILKNIDTILKSDEYISYISSMQKQWRQIKALNCNRVLTLDLALAFVMSNNYTNIEIGNDRLAEVSNQAGYSQSDFDTLQQIYNYGKIRTFNSIPRIKSTVKDYTYEILRLDDPLALAIGTLTDCCQELGASGETSMEHSMVSEHGRIFVIKDSEGNIVAQSWMWRNRKVICFDNIEIPNKAFTRAQRSGSTKDEFTDTVFRLYQQAGEELIKKDEETYLKLLNEGKITKEQYEDLKLEKVTVGEGYNDIADSLERNAKHDTVNVAPIDFLSPVLDGNLYVDDSFRQYVIAGKSDIITNKFITPITVYQDEFIIYDDSNTKIEDALALQKLEFATKKYHYNGRTEVDEENNIITNIAYNYDLNAETTKVVMNSNFAIIYDIRAEEIIIADILYNTKINVGGENMDITDLVVMQIGMALQQIQIEGKKFNISELEEEQADIFNIAINLYEELDILMGIKSLS